MRLVQALSVDASRVIGIPEMTDEIASSCRWAWRRTSPAFQIH